MNVLLGISGSIAAYKAADLARLFIKRGDSVVCCTTPNALNFVTPLTLESLTGNAVYRDEFALDHARGVEHIGLAKWCDIFIIAPATASLIAKLAHGIADNPVATLYLACRAPILLAPAMNTAMLEHRATQRNLATLRADGVTIIEPACGLLACNDIGKGKLAEVSDIFAAALRLTHPARQQYAGKKVLITAGPTRERIDPVRYLSNFSSGKMGFALARAFANRGADVTLIAGPVALATPFGVKRIDVESASEMANAVFAHALRSDIIIKAAAVADYRPALAAQQKCKKGTTQALHTIELTENIDILHTLCQQKQAGQYIVGFAAETENLLEHAQQKLQRKGADMIVANQVGGSAAVFGSDQNAISLVTSTGVIATAAGSKDDVAETIAEQIHICLTLHPNK
ncbi:bifunctional phosphopantothenoylcysteine decarboxylase/phosphopantothenate--cysteine ligase CoaBC [Chrysiogenes arsenatis]|uniref:bifunctional phosphopantothenoylcysteine decarboxylase/phosphopantothenate--cysteine ligase CoaBC n=1 Tax=Chrysiogenes arsenatis TaxID=309797 RepID=UPI0004296034|nr:bifunctional phosphopantothenoylcysteine decarboxylase/phosphopantothenate--cysteine ligase CoaBC [Chrysiogenes arsenatis]